MKKQSGGHAQRAAIVAALALGAALPAMAAGKHAASCQVRMADVSFFHDQALTVELGTKLSFNKALLGEQVSAKVTGGVATLSGRVSAPEMVKIAAGIAAKMNGIRCVQNYIEVGPPLPRDTTPQSAD